MQKEAWLFILPLQEKGLARGGRDGRNEGNDKDLNVFMSANVFLVPCVSYLLGSKGNMPTGLPGVFTVFRLGVYKTQIPGGCKNHILRLDHSREADLCNLLLKLRPNVFIYFAKGKRTL